MACQWWDSAIKNARPAQCDRFAGVTGRPDCQGAPARVHGPAAVGQRRVRVIPGGCREPPAGDLSGDGGRQFPQVTDRNP